MVVHKEGMKPVTDQRLLRRGGVYYYRRRVPLSLVDKLGRKVVQLSLHTTSLKEARKLRTLRDLEWDARFEAYSLPADQDAGLKSTFQPILGSDLIELVRDYVERQDRQAEECFASCYPETPHERHARRVEVEFEAQTLREPQNPQTQQWIDAAGRDMLKPIGKALHDPEMPTDALSEWVRRGLLELNRRRLARLADDRGQAFFDQLFDPTRPAEVAFGTLAEQCLRMIEEEAAINRLSQKWVDKQRANLALIREIVADGTPVQVVDYDVCLHVRSVLARVPANRTKLYGSLSIEHAIERAKKEGKPLLSPVTQELYLNALRDVLDLAAKKRLITVNPAEGLKPIKRDNVSPGDKRRPFTLQQLADFFNSTFYVDCAQHSPPFAHDKPGWRFWLPLMCLFMGMRPNEAAQMHVNDLKHTKKGTWYLDIVATADEDEKNADATSSKTLKTKASRRKIPLHPVLLKIGLVQFVEQRKKAGTGPRLFPDLAADKYGNFASYALKRFRDDYLPSAIKLEARQSFYSFRHSWRDALRRIDAQPATLQALGAWSQGKLTSDDYGDKSDPDYQAQFMQKISFPGLDLSTLYLQVN